MAKKKLRPDQKPAATPKPNRTGLPLHVYLEPTLRLALDDLLSRTRRTLTAEVSIAVENHLKAAGLWPPPPHPPAG